MVGILLLQGLTVGHDDEDAGYWQQQEWQLCFNPNDLRSRRCGLWIFVCNVQCTGVLHRQLYNSEENTRLWGDSDHNSDGFTVLHITHNSSTSTGTVCSE